jgi:hypothetical protein
MRLVVFVLSVSLVACTDINLTGPTINNTNTNTNNNDIHDLVNFLPAANPTAPVPSPNGGNETPLPLPAGAQVIVQNYALANPTQLTNSCQDKTGEAAWAFMDGVVNTLKATDPRWGYMVKPNTGTISRDVIAYRATSDNSGAWGVDIIIDHCGTSTFGWGVLGFDPNVQWSGTRF